MTKQTLTDPLDPARSAALHAALGRDGPALAAGDPLPPFFHQLHFWNPQPPAALGRDGHPARGGLIPDLGLPRRMWAGGRLEFHAPLRLGQSATRVTRPGPVTRKEGRSGPLAFVTLRHEISQDGRLCVTEDQDLVYRADPAPGTPAPVPPRARTDEEDARPLAFSSTLLFRYSALTFNGHRIHYDLDYCRQVEGYPGLVVHGPLLAQLMMLWADEREGPLTRFAFRASAPLTHEETAEICVKGQEFWIRAADGREIMTGSSA